MRKNKLLLLLALLMTAATGAWAQTETLLTTITPTGKDTYSETTAGVVTVTHDNDNFYGKYGWVWWDNTGSVTVVAKEGYTITRCVFRQNGKTVATISTSPFKINFIYNADEEEYYCEGTDPYEGLNGVSSIEVYGYAPAPAPAGYTVTMKDGVKDADKWTVKVGEGQAQALPIGGLKGDGSETVTLQYNGRLKVKGVKATSDAAPAEEPVTLATPLTVEAVTPGTIRVNIDGTLYSGMKYSVNGGTKTTITETTTIEGLKAGDKVQFYGNGTQTQAYGDSPEVRIEGSGDGFQTKAYGNIMSLLDEEGFATKTDLPNNTKFVFYGLFRGNSTLIDASELLLPATTLTEACYSSMFNGCTSLTTAPKLPATTLPANCYYGMFYGCTSLTSAYVKAAYIDDSNDSMFNDCTATGAVLHTAPGSKASWEFMMGTDKPWDNWTVAGDWEE